jgi:tetratricopeptide (TPR) repeat protein
MLLWEDGMISDRVHAARALLIPTLLVLGAGCAMQPTTQTAAGNQRSVEPSRVTEARPAAPRDDAAPAALQPAPEAAIDPIQAILADRRRSDFPEIELEEYGFTITEQVRVSGDARSEYERALALLRQDRYAEGIAILETVIEQVPDATVPYIDLGIAYRLAGDAGSAEDALAFAAALSPDNPIVHNELGIVYRESGRFADARTSYERALTVFDDFHYARRNLAVLCDLYLADLECALRNYTSYLDSVDSDSEVEIWIADLERRLASQGDL